MPPQISKEKITCQSCRALCCRLEVRLIDESDDQVPEEFVEKTSELYFRMRRATDGTCVALDRENNLCTIYESRPFLCREYEAGGNDCIVERRKAGL